MKKLTYILLFIALIILMMLVVSIHLKNPQEITLSYYFDWQWTAPLMWILSTVFGAGMLLGTVLVSLSTLRSKHQLGKTKRQLAKVEKEVENLRTLPIKDEV